MRLPSSLLYKVRGPLALLAMAGCASPAPAVTEIPLEPIAPSNAPVTAVVAEAPDPVSYDLDAESVRLGRLDQELASGLDRRAERIATADRPAARQPQFDPRWMAACGRG